MLIKNINRFKAHIRSMLPFRPKLSGVRILAYHSIGNPGDHKLAIRVSPENFRLQLDEIIKLGYTTRTVSDILAGGVVSGGDKDIVLTFDDGYKDNATEAASALKVRGMTASFYITACCADGNSQKTWSDGRKREYMNWDDIGRLGRMGFEIGSHMLAHYDLSMMDTDGVVEQLVNSKEEILRNTGIEPRTLSYPYGKFNDMVVNQVKIAGYIGGCSLRKGVNTSKDDPLILRRTEIDGYDTIFDFRSKLNGLYD
jgi:peptidoglycan/xylan/chitin deacetylase (PgdA/CDA1 family)